MMKIIKSLKFNIPDWLPVAFLVAGAILRVTGFTAGSLWYDEAYSLRLDQMGLIQMVQVANLDFNPPGWEILAWPFVQLIGANALGLRFLSLVAGLVSLWLAWVIIRDLIPSKAGRLGAAVLVSLMPVNLWMAQDGRAYGLFTMMFLAAFWFAKNKRWLGFTAAMGLMLYLHNTGMFYCAAVGVGALIMTDKKDRMKVIVSGAGALLAWSPMINVLITNAGRLDFWLGPQTLDYINRSALDAFFVGTLSPVWVGLFSILFDICILAAVILTFGPALSGMADPVTLRIGQMVAGFLRKRDQAAKENTGSVTVNKSLVAFGLVAVGPLVFMALAGWIWKPVIFYRPLQAAVIPLCIWFAAVLTPRRLTFTTWIIPYTWAFLLVVSLMVWTPVNKGGGIEQLAAVISDQYQPGDVIYHATATSYLPFSNYIDQVGYVLDAENEHAGLLQTRIQDQMGIDRVALQDLEYSRAWVVWARDPILSEQSQTRMSEYIRDGQYIGVAGNFQFAPIEVYLVGGE